MTAGKWCVVGYTYGGFRSSVGVDWIFRGITTRFSVGMRWLWGYTLCIEQLIYCHRCYPWSKFKFCRWC